MKRIRAEWFRDQTPEHLLAVLTGRFVIVFSDGEMEVDAKSTIYSSHAWMLFKEFPETPMRRRHHIRSPDMLGDGQLTTDTHRELLGRVEWDVYDAYVSGDAERDAELRDRLAEMVTRLSNNIYNHLTYECEDSVTSLDLLDFVEVADHPVIAEANATVQPTQESIGQTYATIKTVLETAPELSHNAIANAVRSKLANVNQVLQCVGPRGYLTDTDGMQFTTPVLRGFFKGLRAFYDSIVESRSAAKSLDSSKMQLQDAEFFSRRLQLIGQIVARLHHTDCGSQIYLSWKVRGDELKKLEGKHYLDEATGNLRTITRRSKHLIGKTVKLRSVINCAHPDPNGICSTCFGELSLSVPKFTNIGHMCGASMTQQTTQSVLSTKHLDSSVTVEKIKLGEENQKFLKTSRDGYSYLLAEATKGKSIKLVIAPQFVSNVTDVREVHDVTELNISHVSEIEEVTMVVKDAQGIENTRSIKTQVNRRKASFTIQMLRYLRNHGWEVDDRNNMVIDMSNWTWGEPLMTLPLKHYNMADHSKDIAKLLESSVQNIQERDKHVSPSAVLVDLFDLVNSKLNVNLAVLEVVLYGTMVVSVQDHDYGLPKPWTKSGLGTYRRTMQMRSAGAWMAYQEHAKNLMDPANYVYTNVPDHPMDWLVMPGELMKLRAKGYATL